MKEAALVECITCGREDGWVCRNGEGKDVDYFHLQRQLLYMLRQKHPYSQLLGKHEEGYQEEQTWLRALLNARVRGELEEHRKYIQTTAQRVTVMDLIGEMEDL